MVLNFPRFGKEDLLIADLLLLVILFLFKLVTSDQDVTLSSGFILCS